ncbi:hypothetical protein [Vagococcus carniphilus]|nr:hypothetical protein [Vagococcus carniphilus]MDT2865451.1 hypothetical protein [Vagococcus carniphilus]
MLTFLQITMLTIVNLFHSLMMENDGVIKIANDSIILFKLLENVGI